MNNNFLFTSKIRMITSMTNTVTKQLDQNIVTLGFLQHCMYGYFLISRSAVKCEYNNMKPNLPNTWTKRRLNKISDLQDSHN